MEGPSEQRSGPACKLLHDVPAPPIRNRIERPAPSLGQGHVIRARSRVVAVPGGVDAAHDRRPPRGVLHGDIGADFVVGPGRVPDDGKRVPLDAPGVRRGIDDLSQTLAGAIRTIVELEAARDVCVIVGPVANAREITVIVIVVLVVGKRERGGGGRRVRAFLLSRRRRDRIDGVRRHRDGKRPIGLGDRRLLLEHGCRVAAPDRDGSGRQAARHVEGDVLRRGGLVGLRDNAEIPSAGGHHGDVAASIREVSGRRVQELPSGLGELTYVGVSPERRIDRVGAAPRRARDSRRDVVEGLVRVERGDQIPVNRLGDLAVDVVVVEVSDDVDCALKSVFVYVLFGIPYRMAVRDDVRGRGRSRGTRGIRRRVTADCVDRAAQRGIGLHVRDPVPARRPPIVECVDADAGQSVAVERRSKELGIGLAGALFVSTPHVVDVEIVVGLGAGEPLGHIGGHRLRE